MPDRLGSLESTISAHDVKTLGNWWPAPTSPSLASGAVHVWRIAINPQIPQEPYWDVLAPEEQARARRFHLPAHQAMYVVAHGAMRTILAAYHRLPPGELKFETAESGKPGLLHPEQGGELEFNLSHSGDLALLAVARNRAVGVDVELWNTEVEHFHLAEHHFSVAERESLRSLAATPERVIEGFYSAWVRKEAYLKATGHGVARGLDHFDVSLAPGEPAVLIADRRDVDALSRWNMFALPAGTGYSAALVVATPVAGVELFDAPALASRHATNARAKPARTSTM